MPQPAYPCSMQQCLLASRPCCDSYRYADGFTAEPAGTRQRACAEAGRVTLDKRFRLPLNRAAIHHPIWQKPRRPDAWRG